jgi:putative ABC transport system ATP-binding protein
MNERPCALEARELVKTYGLGPQAVVAIDRISLKVYAGEFVAIMGSSGSGKSTLLYLAAGLAEPTSGEVLIKGVPMSKLSDAERARLRNTQVGFVFQRFNLLGFLSVRRNIEVPRLLGGKPNGAARRIDDLLAAVGLAKKDLRRVNELSAGEQQRVAIARALLNNPEILLADEPTGNLDSRNAAAIMDLILRLRHEFGLTVLLVTHNPEVAMKADRILEMQDGTVLRELLPQEIHSRTELARGL